MSNSNKSTYETVLDVLGLCEQDFDTQLQKAEAEETDLLNKALGYISYETDIHRRFHNLGIRSN